MIFYAFLHLLTAALLIPAAAVCLYYCSLAIIALTMRQPRFTVHGQDKPKHTFAIVIPAHNEENIIAKALLSSAALDYPKEKFKIFVIADNCSDRTAEVSVQRGAVCLERSDTTKRGKGHALEWAFPKILSEPVDALVVLDADCQIDANALIVFDQYLLSGIDVLQANDLAANPDESSLSYAVAVGNLIENNLFYAPKSSLGLSVFLRGTGIVLHRKILDCYPWQARSIAEDVEYTLNLIRHCIRIVFVQEVRVLSAFPVDNNQLTVQRARWASGNMELGKSHALKLIREGIATRHRMLLDAGWTLLVLSRPLVFFELFASAMLSLINWVINPSWISSSLLSINFAIIIFQCLYLSLGVVKLGITWQRIQLLINAPVVFFRLLMITLAEFKNKQKDNWAKTPRS